MSDTDRLVKILDDFEGGTTALAKKLLSHPDIKITFNNRRPSLEEIQNAYPGEILSDGSILVFCNLNYALIAAPKETEIKCEWNHRDEVLSQLDGNEWFVPSVGKLYLAYVMCKNSFSSTHYWSSTEASCTNACSVNFIIGSQSPLSKTNSLCVRAFRRVVF